jgi:hypothetical protein
MPLNSINEGSNVFDDVASTVHQSLFDGAVKKTELMYAISLWQGLIDSARHVIGYHLTQ